MDRRKLYVSALPPHWSDELKPICDRAKLFRMSPGGSWSNGRHGASGRSDRPHPRRGLSGAVSHFAGVRKMADPYLHPPPHGKLQRGQMSNTTSFFRRRRGFAGLGSRSIARRVTSSAQSLRVKSLSVSPGSSQAVSNVLSSSGHRIGTIDDVPSLLRDGGIGGPVCDLWIVQPAATIHERVCVEWASRYLAALLAVKPLLHFWRFVVQSRQAPILVDRSQIHGDVAALAVVSLNSSLESCVGFDGSGYGAVAGNDLVIEGVEDCEHCLGSLGLGLGY